MHFLVVFATGLAVAEASSMPPLTEENNNCSGIKNENSLLSSLLEATGYSDTCIASALDFCSTGQEDGRYTSLMEEAREVVQQVSAAVNTWEAQVTSVVSKWDSQLSAAWEPRPRHCKDLLDSGDSGSGVRHIYPYPGQPNHRIPVFCDQTVEGGGWTVLQRRTSDAPRQDFQRTWTEYQLGFGHLEGEFFLGLDLLHQLTSTALQQLRIDLDDYDGEHRWAKYEFFHVGGPETEYRLSIRNYSGDAGDSLAYHNGKQFSTHDADNDSDGGNCAESRQGAWWFGACGTSNLNGYQYAGSDSPQDKGIFWDDFRGDGYSLKRSTMMTRANF